jgi:deferrochelatase/peroxidase EfeB
MNDNEHNRDGLSRRSFLGSGGLAALAAGSMACSGLASAAAALGARQHHAGGTATADIEPFYGVHQNGIITSQQKYSMFAAFELVDGARRSDLIALLKNWTRAAASMSRGGTAAPLADNPDAAPADGGSALGLAPARLTLTFGFGPTLFSRDGVDRFGLAARRPAALVDLPRFNGDQLIAERCGGDLSVQACADDPQVTFHAIRQLLSLADGVATIKWAQNGFSSAPVDGGTGRNLMGFKDGTMNPPTSDPKTMDQVVWAGAEGGWMKNGSYVVARRIRIALEHWDKTVQGFQEEVVGRSKISGAPIGSRHESDPLKLAAQDKDGNPLIPANSHARLSSPEENDGAQILRRAYSYNDGVGFYAERWPPWRQGMMLDAGLFFIAYQRDPRSGFIRINKKLSTLDSMNQYTTHVGSAIFACPPGAQAGTFIGAGLFEG